VTRLKPSMRFMTLLNRRPLRGRSVSILVKVGAIFVVLSVTFGIFLLAISKQTGQLIGTSKAIEQAGTERMRIYKLASLVQQLPDSPSDTHFNEVIREEIAQWERILDGLRVGTSKHGPVATISSVLSIQLQEIQDRWSMQLRPALELALRSTGDDLVRQQQEYLAHVDAFVAGLDHMVQFMEQESASRLQALYRLQIWFLGAYFALVMTALVYLHRVIRLPLTRLTAGAERLAAGELHTQIQVQARDELGQLARTFERMADTIRQKIEEMRALHATGKEIGMLGPGGLDDVLRRIVDRAAESLDADLAVVMVRHLTMECWLVEAASGTAFDQIRKQILLFEETPFANQAFESKQPIVVTDLSDYLDRPIRFRDEFGAKSFLAVPLLGPHGCLGVLALLSITKLRTFTEWDVRLAEQFASYAAVTMENARLFDEVESESHSLRVKLRAVERNVAELTHEVKGPAGRVAEFASWIEQDYGGRLDAKGMQYLGWIKKEGKDLAQLADRTLDLARIKHEPSPLESVDVDVVVGEVFTLLKKECDEKLVRVTIAQDLPRLGCRRIHVKQVFENLIGNAIKYMGNQPHPHVEIGVTESHHGKLLFVRDNGIGIDPSMADRIFLPFYRLESGDIPGAGIGLSIVKTVVEQYDGAVTVESEPGVGSTFYVRLPVLPWKAPLHCAPVNRNGAPGDDQ
jgi:signal transduction histidine kinase/HAMP domain-containing protein